MSVLQARLLPREHQQLQQQQQRTRSQSNHAQPWAQTQKSSSFP